MTVPRPFSNERLKHAWTDFEKAARDTGAPEIIKRAKAGPNRDRLSAIFGNSPYLTRSIIANPAFTAELMDKGPDAVTASILEEIGVKAPKARDVDSLMAILRQAKTRFALAVAAADIWEMWTLGQVTESLSRFAELTLELAVAHLLRAGMIKGELAPPDGVSDPASVPAEADLSRASGFFVLGMGKLGARELNYSSDIDLILLFDNETVRYTGRKSIQQFFVRLARDLVRIMQERTGDGYVFRTDLRLRPDPGATPLALSVDAAEIYYQSVGLNWERAAMIKARPVAGDLDAGKAFLGRIRAFVWRKHLDFAAIEDIHAIKNQIHRHHRHGDIAVAGQDVKLGRGGIREIEFFAQIHQLIAGGREHDLRDPRTLGALDALRTMGKISDTECGDLSDAYRFLRRVEHRIQMINDEQTHEIPENGDGVEHLAVFLGYDSADAFCKVLLGHLKQVNALYDALLEHPGGDRRDASEGTLDLPADVTSPEMLKTLDGLGYDDAARMAAIVEGWQFGRYRALRTPRSRNLLQSILPRILSAFADTADPDLALVRFDEFLGKLPSGVQILSLFQANPWLLEVVAEIMGIAPALAEQLARRPLLLDAVLSPDFFNRLEPLNTLRAGLEEAVSRAQHYEEVLDITRIWVNEQKFRVGVQMLRATVEAGESGRAFSDIADALIQVLFDTVCRDFATRHGKLPGGRFAIVGMGKFGGQELTFTSDLDLIFIYELDNPDVTSDGKKPLTPGHYYTRLAQVFINAITAPTGEGTLYEVDMRLRPSGNAGPLAVSLKAFRQYQEGQAWTWEHMALTRSRVCAGDAALGKKVAASIRAVLARPRNPNELRDQVADMRRRLRKEFGTGNMWSVKHCPGGMVDIEFICQYLTLLNAADTPDLITPSIPDTIDRLGKAGHLAPDAAGTLAAAYQLQATVQGLLRLCVGNGFDPAAASAGLKAALAKATDHESFDALAADLETRQKQVGALFESLLG